MVVGITGGIGSGKTTVCKIFELLGVPVFYADDEAKKLYDNAQIRLKVLKLFGKKILGADKKIDKKKLAEIVFSDKVSLSKLNALIHPQVGKKFNEWKKKQIDKKYVLKEAAIMIESGAYKKVDYLVSVNSSKELKIKRLLINNKSSIIDINRRTRDAVVFIKSTIVEDVPFSYPPRQSVGEIGCSVLLENFET